MTDNFVKGSKKRIVWSHEDKVFLKENYHLMSNEELMEHLDKNLKQIKNQAQRQYLTKRGRREKRSG